MGNLRVTDSDIGQIHHRPSTNLLPPSRCFRGHLAPKYFGNGSGYCVVCARMNGEAYYVQHRPAERQRARPMRKYADIQQARQDHAENGGWLLRLDRGLFGVTDSYSLARKLRGAAYLARCERLQEWDETEMQPVRLRQVGRQAEARAA